MPAIGLDANQGYSPAVMQGERVYQLRVRTNGRRFSDAFAGTDSWSENSSRESVSPLRLIPDDGRGAG